MADSETPEESGNTVEGVLRPDIPAERDPNRIPLYGGISGLPISIPEYVLCKGLIVREAYAHVMAPYIVAFKSPERPGAPHPGPWKAAQGGLGFDVTIEVALAQDSRPTGLDRLNTLWLVVALLRLATGAALRMPVISDVAFAAVPSSEKEPMLWTIEMPPQQLHLTREPPDEVTEKHLQWVRKSILKGAELLNDEAFNRAFKTFDSAVWSHSTGSAIIMAWAALETLFRPGRRRITKTLAISIATFLHPAGAQRDRAYQYITKLYETRGSAAHDAQLPEFEQLISSFELARQSITKCIETGEMPNRELLLNRWKERL